MLRTPEGRARRRHARGRALRRPHPPRHAGSGTEGAGAVARRPGRSSSSNDLPRPGTGGDAGGPLRRGRDRRRDHRARAWRSTPPRAATRSRWSSAATSRRAPRAAPRRWSTAASATCRTSTSAWSARRCSSASCWSGSRRTSSTRRRSWFRRSGGERKNRALGIGLNMYDVMATSRIGRGRSQRNEHREEAEYWSPDRHRTISGEEAAELIPALEPMEPELGLPLLRLPDRRRAPRAHRARRGRALRRGDRQRRGGDRGPRRRRAGRGRRLHRGRVGRAVRGPRRQRRQRHRRLGRPDPPG